MNFIILSHIINLVMITDIFNENRKFCEPYHKIGLVGWYKKIFVIIIYLNIINDTILK